MKQPMLVMLGVLVAAIIALGFLIHSSDPFTASLEIKALFFVSAAIGIVSLSMMVLYAIAVGWHNGMQYFFAKYFGPEAPYFKSAFRRSILIGVLAMVLVGLRRYGFFTQYFAAGVTAIIVLLELFYSAHEKQVNITS